MIDRSRSLCTILTGALLVFLPQMAAACEKCFGGAAANSATTRGIGLAMLALLIITAVVLGGITLFFLYMRKRAKMLASGDYIVNEKGTILSLPRRLMENSPHL